MRRWVLGGRPGASSVAYATLVMLATTATPAVGAVVVLDFEGLRNLQRVEEFYNGGTGGGGNSGTDYGVSSSQNAFALIDIDAGGAGDFGGEPSSDTAMVFVGGAAAALNYADGFDTEFSFFYSAIRETGSVLVYDGLDATGNLLASIDLPLTPHTGAPDPGGEFSPFVAVDVSFAGTARSVDFGGTTNEIIFDNITFSSAEAVGNEVVPEPGTVALLGLGSLGLGVAALRRRCRAARG